MEAPDIRWTGHPVATGHPVMEKALWIVAGRVAPGGPDVRWTGHPVVTGHPVSAGKITPRVSRVGLCLGFCLAL